MQQSVQFVVKKNYSLPIAIEHLKALGLDHIYTIDDREKKIIGGCMPYFCSALPKSIESVEIIPDIDWTQQSFLFSPYFHEGKIIIPLKDFSDNQGRVLLQPGAGFGDVSHPTTKLMLTWLEEYVQDTVVFDVGCGCGVLTFSAKALGAYKAFGVDIDPLALKNCQDNKILNPNIDVSFGLSFPSSCVYDKNLTLLMNMTFLEQKEAYSSLASHFHKGRTIITSGILSSRKASYLEWAAKLGWKLKDERQEDMWSSFLFYQERLESVPY